MEEKLLPSSIATSETTMEKAPFVTFLSKKIILPSSTMPSEQYSYSTVRRLCYFPLRLCYFPLLSREYTYAFFYASYHQKNILASSFVTCTIVFFYSILGKLYLHHSLPPILDEENTIAFFYNNIRKKAPLVASLF
jgi:hypothetical protein